MCLIASKRIRRTSEYASSHLRDKQIVRLNRAAFSLTELLVVIVIIGLLATMVTVGTRGYLAASRKGTAKMEVARIVDALEAYNGVNSGYPSTDQGLEALMESTDDFPGGYLKGGDLNDPWGQPYEYIVPGTDNEPFDVICSGPDKIAGTDDDIVSFNLSE